MHGIFTLLALLQLSLPDGLQTVETNTPGWGAVQEEVFPTNIPLTVQVDLNGKVLDLDGHEVGPGGLREMARNCGCRRALARTRCRLVLLIRVGNPHYPAAVFGFEPAVSRPVGRRWRNSHPGLL